MFMLTAKFNKKIAIVIVLAAAVVLCAIILLAGRRDRDNTAETSALSAVVKNNDQRVGYLESLGWVVETAALEEQNVMIPREFSEVYKNYNDLQIRQGFDLSKYGGIEATRYTYKVLNYPGAAAEVVADIIVYRGKVIAGDVQSYSADGFMSGLLFPKVAPPSPSAPQPSADPAPDSPDVSEE